MADDKRAQIVKTREHEHLAQHTQDSEERRIAADIRTRKGKAARDAVSRRWQMRKLDLIDEIEQKLELIGKSLTDENWEEYGYTYCEAVSQGRFRLLQKKAKQHVFIDILEYQFTKHNCYRDHTQTVYVYVDTKGSVYARMVGGGGLKSLSDILGEWGVTELEVALENLKGYRSAADLPLAMST